MTHDTGLVESGLSVEQKYVSSLQMSEDHFPLEVVQQIFGNRHSLNL
jgi:hypothetical protein